MRTEIYSLAFGGEGIGKIDGKICFVEGALPGEEVEFEAVKVDPKFIKGRVVEVLKPSEDRVAPECPYYKECGGCQLQHILYEKELYYKELQVKDLLERISGIKEPIVEAIVPSDSPYNYRSSVTLHRRDGKYGFVARDKEIIVAIDKCAIAEESLNESIGELSASGKDDVTLKSDHNGNVWSSTRPGQRFYVDRYNGFDMYLSPKAFSQANRYIAGKVSDVLNDWIGVSGEGAVFFDAYCGAGFFTFLASKDFSLKIGMDISRIAIDCAKTTLRNSDLTDIKFYKDDAEKEFFNVFSRNKSKENILFLDPPRIGCKKGFLEMVSNCGDLDKVYYLSCDPARLARDVKLLTAEGGLELTRVQPFDMFPQTKHVEVLAEFVRK